MVTLSKADQDAMRARLEAETSRGPKASKKKQAAPKKTRSKKGGQPEGSDAKPKAKAKAKGKKAVAEDDENVPAPNPTPAPKPKAKARKPKAKAAPKKKGKQGSKVLPEEAEEASRKRKIAKHPEIAELPVLSFVHLVVYWSRPAVGLKLKTGPSEGKQVGCLQGVHYTRIAAVLGR